MSYHGRARSTDELCFPREAVMRLQPRAAGPLYRDLVTLTGPAESIRIPPERGLLVIDPKFDKLPPSHGFERRLA